MKQQSQTTKTDAQKEREANRVIRSVEDAVILPKEREKKYIMKNIKALPWKTISTVVITLALVATHVTAFYYGTKFKDDWYKSAKSEASNIVQLKAPQESK